MTFEETLHNIGIKSYKGAGQGEVRICCPFCIDRGETADTRFRLGVNHITSVAHCFNCNWRSSNPKTLQVILTKLNHPDVVFESEEEVEEDKEIVTLPEGFEILKSNKIKSWYHAKALKYLKQREIPDWQIEAKKTGITIIGNYAYRIIWPIVDKRELVGIVGRTFAKNIEPKYLNSKGDKYLFNCPQQKKDIKTIILSEGIFKALKIERVVMKASAALLGHSISSVQINQLKQFKDLNKVVVWPDPDKVGIKGTIDVCSKLKEEGYKVYTIYPLPEKQADELEDKVVKRHIENKVLFNSFVEQRLKKDASFL